MVVIVLPTIVINEISPVVLIDEIFRVECIVSSFVVIVLPDIVINEILPVTSIDEIFKVEFIVSVLTVIVLPVIVLNAIGPVAFIDEIVSVELTVKSFKKPEVVENELIVRELIAPLSAKKLVVLIVDAISVELIVKELRV